MSGWAVSSSFSLVMLALAALQLILPALVVANNAIPTQLAQLDSWIAQNIKEYKQRKGDSGVKALDPKLIAAEDNVRLIKVRKDGKGEFTTITDAIKSVPSGNTRRVVISIGGGVYREKITIDRSKPFITFLGEKGSMPNIAYDGTAAKYGTLYSATVAVESDYFVAVNIAFVNSAPMPSGKRTGEQAVAMRISGDKAAFHGCHFIGFQDTLCDDRGKHLFTDCYIRGTVDFIFGNGRSLYLKTTIESVAKEIGVITAQAREKDSDDSGFTFAHCKIVGSGKTYLGRAWKDRARVVFAYTHMGSVVHPQGWSDSMYDKQTKKSMYYAEYKCTGPGANTSGRAKYVRMLTGEEANALFSMTYIQGNKWLLPPPSLSYIQQHFPPSKLH